MQKIVTSNITEENWTYQVNYNDLSGAFNQESNSLIMMLKQLKDLNVERIVLARADGFREGADNYYSSSMVNYVGRGNSFNLDVAVAIKKLDIAVEF